MSAFPKINAIWVYLAASPLLGLTITLFAYLVAQWIYARCRFNPLANPVLIAVANHWMVRKGFWFADGGMEFPLAWVSMLIAQALLGDGAFALRVPALPWERARPATA